MIDIKKSLDILGIKETNHGTSTGLQSFGGGKEISSFSPVDGSLIGKVTTTTSEEYEKVIQSGQSLFKEWRLSRLLKRGNCKTIW